MDESIADLSLLFDAAPLGVLAISADGVIRYVNARQCQNSELPREFFVGKAYRPTFGPTIEKSGLLPLYDRLVETGEPFEATLLDYKRHVDGASLAFNLRGFRAGPWILLVTSVEETLATQAQHYLQLFENANDGIFVLSREGRFTRVNPRFSEMVGVPIEQLIGKTTEMFLPGRLTESLARVERILSEGHLGPYELEIATPKGPRHVSLNGFALLEKGKPVGVINIARDVTEEHRQAEELRAARDQALEASRLKSTFLANMSHEIRTPLNIILGYASILVEEIATTDEARGMLEGIQRAGRGLQETIDSILDISKLEAGAFPLRPETIGLAALVERQVTDFYPLAHKKGLELSYQISEPDVAVRFDRYCLTHALMNLVANAIKFTLAGFVRVEVSRDSAGQLLLRVCDSGVGIDPAFLPRLGEPFLQEEHGLTRGFEGSGLGFALTRRYAELNGATLSVESEKGRGSVITIHFTTEVRLRKSMFDTDLKQARVLLVEDDQDTRTFMKTLLGSHCNLSSAPSSAEAMSILSEHRVDLVLMDLALPGGEDGLALTQRIRSNPRWKDLPIIAITAHAFRENRQAALDAGCDDYLAKPFTSRQLVEKMAAALRGK